MIDRTCKHAQAVKKRRATNGKRNNMHHKAEHISPFTQGGVHKCYSSMDIPHGSPWMCLSKSPCTKIQGGSCPQTDKHMDIRAVETPTERADLPQGRVNKPRKWQNNSNYISTIWFDDIFEIGSRTRKEILCAKNNQYGRRTRKWECMISSATKTVR